MVVLGSPNHETISSDHADPPTPRHAEPFPGRATPDRRNAQTTGGVAPSVSIKCLAAAHVGACPYVGRAERVDDQCVLPIKNPKDLWSM